MNIVHKSCCTLQGESFAERFILDDIVKKETIYFCRNSELFLEFFYECSLTNNSVVPWYWGKFSDIVDIGSAGNAALEQYGVELSKQMGVGHDINQLLLINILFFESVKLSSRWFEVMS